MSILAALLLPTTGQAEIPLLFREEAFHAATLAQAVKVWQNLRWNKQLRTFYDFLEDRVWAFIQSQADNVP